MFVQEMQLINMIRYYLKSQFYCDLDCNKSLRSADIIAQKDSGILVWMHLYQTFKKQRWGGGGVVVKGIEKKLEKELPACSLIMTNRD